VRIPQISDPQAAAAATGSQRACLKMHPTREEQVRCAAMELPGSCGTAVAAALNLASSWHPAWTLV
jgi:hypothetical protein